MIAAIAGAYMILAVVFAGLLLLACVFAPLLMAKNPDAVRPVDHDKRLVKAFETEQRKARQKAPLAMHNEYLDFHEQDWIEPLREANTAMSERQKSLPRSTVHDWIGEYHYGEQTPKAMAHLLYRASLLMENTVAALNEADPNRLPVAEDFWLEDYYSDPANLLQRANVIVDKTLTTLAGEGHVTKRCSNCKSVYPLTTKFFAPRGASWCDTCNACPEGAFDPRTDAIMAGKGDTQDLSDINAETQDLSDLNAETQDLTDAVPSPRLFLYQMEPVEAAVTITGEDSPALRALWIKQYKKLGAPLFWSAIGELKEALDLGKCEREPPAAGRLLNFIMVRMGLHVGDR